MRSAAARDKKSKKKRSVGPQPIEICNEAYEMKSCSRERKERKCMGNCLERLFCSHFE
jgi:hypothetical protein